MYFTIFGSQADYGKVRMNDILNEKNAIYIPPIFYKENKLQEFLWRIHNSKKINSYVNLPFKKIWYKYFYDPSFLEVKDKVCFIFEEFSPIPFNKGFLTFLKQKYKLAKFVFLFSNPINIRLEQKLEYLNEMFDLILTFDKKDAEKYNLVYFQSHYSRIPISSVGKNQVDVFFIGAEKGRLQTILNVYEKLKKNGLSCDFNIVDVDEDKKIYKDDITYNIRLSYMEVLQRIQNSTCLLEIVQDNQVGPTLRTLEAVAYNKKLLTNNASIVDEPFFQGEYISVVQDLKNIDINFIKKGIEDIDYHYIEKLSPKNLLSFIEAFFENMPES